MTLLLSSSHPAEGSVSSNVVLPAGSTESQLVTVTGVDDMILDGEPNYTITTGTASSTGKAYAFIDPLDVVVTNIDNVVEEEMFIDGFETIVRGTE